MPLSKPALIATATCGSCIVAVGIVCLVLGLLGYFEFNDPCAAMKSFRIDSVDMDGGFLGSLTGGLIGNEIELQMTLIIEVNNTNVYDLDYEQGEQGVVVVPADVTDSLEEDLQVGTWSVPKGTLKKEAVNDIPVDVTINFDLTGPGIGALASNVGQGGAVVFRITGGIDGKSWVPGVKGESDFLCDASFGSILDDGETANISCRNTKSVANVNVDEDEVNLLDNEVDESCWV